MLCSTSSAEVRKYPSRYIVGNVVQISVSGEESCSCSRFVQKGLKTHIFRSVAGNMSTYGKVLYWLLVGGYFVFVFLCVVYHYHLRKKHEREIDEKCGLIEP